MNRNSLEKIAKEFGYTLFKAKVKEFDGEVYNWYIAKDCSQYSGGNNTPIRFKTLIEVNDHFEYLKLKQI